MKPLLVFEDTTRPRWRLWTALGVEWWATRWVWVSPLFWMALGCAVAWSDPAAAGSSAARQATLGAAFGLADPSVTGPCPSAGSGCSACSTCASRSGR